jgi:ADP-heptose:LPS heptosyltransferase
VARFVSIILRLLPRLGNADIDFSAKKPETIAVVNWENIGDFVLFTPVLRQIRLNFPTSKIILVSQDSMDCFAEFCPYVDEWIVVKGHFKAKPGMAYGKPTPYLYKLIFTYLKLLKSGKGKLGFIFGPDWLLFSDPRQPSRNLLQKKTFNESRQVNDNLKLEMYKENDHQVTRMLSIIEMYGLKIFDDHLENWLFIDTKSASDLVKSQKRTIVFPLGAGQLRRSWPIEKVRDLCNRISSDFPDYEFFFLGPQSLATQESYKILSKIDNSRILLGKTTLIDSARLVAESEMVITNDSGVAHIAASLKRKTIVISAHALSADKWHLNSPARYSPWQNDGLILQPKELTNPCVGNCTSLNPHCILGISVDEVYSAFKKLKD